MTTYVYLVFLIIVVIQVTGQESFIEDYYWRDYEGILPADALPGGNDANGRPIFIGQALFQNKLIPGKIFRSDNQVYFYWGSERKSEQNVKILCTKSPKDFEWIPATHNQLAGRNNKNFVKGGFQPNHYTYVGKAHVVGETTIGKVVCGGVNCLAWYVTTDGKVVQYRDGFEVLSYNPNKKTPGNYNQLVDGIFRN